MFGKKNSKGNGSTPQPVPVKYQLPARHGWRRTTQEVSFAKQALGLEVVSEGDFALIKPAGRKVLNAVVLHQAPPNLAEMMIRFIPKEMSVVIMKQAVPKDLKPWYEMVDSARAYPFRDRLYFEFLQDYQKWVVPPGSNPAVGSHVVVWGPKQKFITTNQESPSARMWGFIPPRDLMGGFLHDVIHGESLKWNRDPYPEMYAAPGLIKWMRDGVAYGGKRYRYFQGTPDYLHLDELLAAPIDIRVQLQTTEQVLGEDLLIDFSDPENPKDTDKAVASSWILRAAVPDNGHPDYSAIYEVLRQTGSWHEITNHIPDAVDAFKPGGRMLPMWEVNYLKKPNEVLAQLAACATRGDDAGGSLPIGHMGMFDVPVFADATQWKNFGLVAPSNAGKSMYMWLILSLPQTPAIVSFNCGRMPDLKIAKLVERMGGQILTIDMPRNAETEEAQRRLNIDAEGRGLEFALNLTKNFSPTNMKGLPAIVYQENPPLAYYAFGQGFFKGYRQGWGDYNARTGFRSILAAEDLRNIPNRHSSALHDLPIHVGDQFKDELHEALTESRKVGVTLGYTIHSIAELQEMMPEGFDQDTHAVFELAMDGHQYLNVIDGQTWSYRYPRVRYWLPPFITRFIDG